MYLLRLDDASEYMDIDKWNRIEKILDKHSVCPIVGIIPNNKDKDLVSKYEFNPDFWKKAKAWEIKGWTIALHGYTHVYLTDSGGINPVNLRSEFAGVPLKEQKRKIRKGLKILKENGIEPNVFFAPSHTFDLNTLKALKEESNIRIISDTVANDIYKWNDFYFVPQQSGMVRKLPFKVTTFCYHPNEMIEKDFIILERFIEKYSNKFINLQSLKLQNRQISLYDKVLRKMYFLSKNVRNFIRGR